MAECCSLSVTKILLIIFNIFFWICGCGILGVGVWFKVDPTIINLSEAIKVDYIDSGKNMDAASVIEIVAFVFIAAGVFVFIVGFCGCCGAVRESRLFLGAYIFCLVVIFGLEFAGGIVAIVKREEIDRTVRDKGAEFVNKRYMFNQNNVDKALNYLMLYNECCGMNSYRDFLNSTYLEQNIAPSHLGRELPMSYACCQSSRSPPTLLQTIGGAVLESPEAANATLCRTEAYGVYVDGQSKDDLKHFHPDGCHQAFREWIDSNLLILIIVGIAIAAVQVMGFVFALCLCRNIDPKAY